MSSGLSSGVVGAQRVEDEAEGLAGDVALEDAQGVLAAVAVLASSFGEFAGPGVVDHAVVRDGPQGVVGLAVTAAAEPVPVALAAAGLDGAGAAERGEGRVAVQPVRVAAAGDEQLGRAVDADSRALDELGCGASDLVAQGAVQFEDLGM